MLVLLCYIRYAPRWDCGSEYEIHVELLNQRKKPVQTFAPKTVYFEQWNDQKWNQVRTKHEEFINTTNFRGGAKPEDNSRLTDMSFPDDPCFPELWTRSEIHPLHPWRQGHAVLGRMVWNPCHWQLRWDMSSYGHIALWDPSNACFLPLPEIAKLHQVLFALYNLQSFLHVKGTFLWLKSYEYSMCISFVMKCHFQNTPNAASWENIHVHLH